MMGSREHTASLRLHGQVAAASISVEWPVNSKLGEDFPHTARGAEDIVTRVDGEGKEEDDEDDDQRVDVVGDEGGLDASKEGISDDTWKEHRISSGNRSMSRLRQNLLTKWEKKDGGSNRGAR